MLIHQLIPLAQSFGIGAVDENECQVA
jgi:hypothetical protein